MSHLLTNHLRCGELTFRYLVYMCDNDRFRYSANFSILKPNSTVDFQLLPFTGFVEAFDILYSPDCIATRFLHLFRISGL